MHLRLLRHPALAGDGAGVRSTGRGHTGMRRLVMGAAVVLLLAGCDSPADPSDSESKPPSAAGSTAQAWKANLDAVCDALKTTVRLPGEGTVRYTAKFNKPTGWATNAPVCGIEPEGEYYDVAAKVPAFGRARFDYGVLTEAELQRLGFRSTRPRRRRNYSPSMKQIP
jgi:hypothetical protein